ncbi:MAG: diacylglycerol kinase family lipid kinase [Caldisericia bacterium]|nr:diacylglycerol kinase family lipid kinase [Caldisericia bacterium]
MPDRSVVFIVNPIAGGGSARSSLPLFQDFCTTHHLPYETFETQYPGHAISIARDYAQTEKIVCAVGGDGTVNEVMTGLMQGSATLAMLPYGSGNDIAGSFQIQKENALDCLLYGSPTKVDIGQVNDTYFLGVASCGFDSKANEIANGIPRFIKGALLYILAFLITYIAFGNDEFTITLPDEEIKGRCLLVAVGNGDRYGGGMKVTPNASRFDHLFDLCLVGNITKWELITVFPRVFKGTHLTHPKVRSLRTSSLTIQGKSWVYADGERKTSLPATYRIIPNGMKVLLPVL